MDTCRKEYWSIGVLEYWKKLKPNFKLTIINPLLHHSITPAGPHTKERPCKPLLGQLKARSSGPGFFISELPA
jgi:hypothetical protein